jgi:small-conductance mechanosensitive channel
MMSTLPGLWNQMSAPLLGGGVLVAALGVGFVVHWVASAILRRALSAAGFSLGPAVMDASRRPSRWIVALLLVNVALPGVDLGPALDGPVRLILHMAMIGSITWLAVSLLVVGERQILRRHRLDVADNLEARRLHTQVGVIRRVIAVFIVIIGAAAAIMVLPGVRQIGASLLASAGLAGLVIGMAARPALANIIAGLQIAMTQPIRIDDVLIVRGEWGRVEEITGTYVVVAIWDQRRLIVPFSQFIEESFENWTRRSAEILGTVFLYADYTVAVPEVRAEVERFVREAPQWDGRVVGLVVTDARAECLELRALVSAADSGAAWELRCALREHLVGFLQQRFPDALPRTRVLLQPAPGDGRSAEAVGYDSQPGGA